MNIRKLMSAAFVFALVGAGFTAINAEAQSRSAFRVKVTIQNLTYDQIFSPPVLAIHNDSVSFFQLGAEASEELSMLAEDGMTDPLVGLLDGSSAVFDYAVGSGPILPGQSASFELGLAPHFRRLSLAGMLVSTNDAFVGLESVIVPFGAQLRNGEMIYALAYDAGSEANTEDCDHIPGPPCGNPLVRVTDGAEGFVHVHRGIQGIGDLDVSKDWRGPVALVTIERAF